ADDLREEHKNTLAALDDVRTQRDLLDERTLLAESRLAENYLDHGRAVSELESDPGKAMLHMVRALEFAPDRNPELQRTIRTELTAWRRELHFAGPILSHQAPVRSLAFSRDGKTVLTGSVDKTARLWEAATGKPIGL